MIDEDTKTLWCGNLSDQVTEELLYELFLQAGPLESVKIPRQKNFAFITFCHEVSVPYALNLFRGTALYSRTLNLQSKGRMVMLPPPVRCYGLEMPPMNFQIQDKVSQNFLEMTERMRQDNPLSRYSPNQQQDSSDKLVMASLQGNWTHRHHPYRSKDKMYSREDYRHGDNSRDYRHGDNHKDYRHGNNQNNHRHGDHFDDYRHGDKHNNYKSNSKHSNSYRDRRNQRNHRRD